MVHPEATTLYSTAMATESDVRRSRAPTPCGDDTSRVFSDARETSTVGLDDEADKDMSGHADDDSDSTLRVRCPCGWVIRVWAVLRFVVLCCVLWMVGCKLLEGMRDVHVRYESDIASIRAVLAETSAKHSAIAQAQERTLALLADVEGRMAKLGTLLETWRAVCLS